MSFIALVPIFFGILGLGVAYLIFQKVKEYPAGDAKVTQIGDAIHVGAMVFVRREHKTLGMLVAVLFVVLWSLLGLGTAFAFVVGALAAAAAGHIGLSTATSANAPTTIAAHARGLSEAFSVAFFGGSITGLAVASLGLLGLGALYLFFGGDPGTAHAIHGFGIGAASVALFSRVGGGIYAQSVAAGADQVCDLETGMRRNDPRNPGVIASNVGNDVGDVAGTGSDILTSHCGAMIATVAIASTMGADLLERLGERPALMFLPLALASTGLLCSIAGIGLARHFSSESPEVALRTATIGATILFMVASLLVIKGSGTSGAIWGSVLAGAVGGIVIGLTTEYYSGRHPASHIAASSMTGPATVVIAGLAAGMRSVAFPMLALCLIIAVATEVTGLGLYGVGIAAVGMLGTVGITMAINAYRPVADSAGAIAEMGGLGHETQAVTHSLAELGNLAAAGGKGFAIGAAAIAGLAVIVAFLETVSHHHPSFVLELNDPHVLIGLLIGGILPFSFAAMTMTAVSDVTSDVIDEIRRQLREVGGVLEGRTEPDTGRCVDVVTAATFKRMVVLGAIAVAMPWVVGVGLSAQALGGMLGGALLGAILLAFTLCNAGAALNSAKNRVEKGHHGGKGSDAHAAVTVGDTFGDPLKNVLGPSMNVLINMMAIMSLVIAPLL